MTKQISLKMEENATAEIRKQESERLKHQHEFESGNDNAFKNCIIPEYELDKRLNRQKGN